MVSLLVRPGVLLVVSPAIWLAVWGARSAVRRARRRALQAAPLVLPAAPGPGSEAPGLAVRILAFRSAGCHQCHPLQRWPLQRVLEAQSSHVVVVEVDAPGAPDLTKHSRVLTVPTTVVLDASGQAHAVNYGLRRWSACWSSSTRCSRRRTQRTRHRNPGQRRMKHASHGAPDAFSRRVAVWPTGLDSSSAIIG
jgi:hypothetical protein